MKRNGGGFVAVEALVALLLSCFLLQLGSMVAVRVGRAVTVLAGRAERLGAARTTAWVLQQELDGARAALDVSRPSRDSMALRAFRGWAGPCTTIVGDGIIVRFRGVRSPDPDKDSVLVLDDAAQWRAYRLLGADPLPSGCRPDEGAVLRLRLEHAPQQAVLLRIFEWGSYHLADGTFRYRLGSGGRQPLTPPVLDPAGSGLTSAAPNQIILTIGWPAGGGGAPLQWTRAFQLGHAW